MAILVPRWLDCSWQVRLQMCLKFVWWKSQIVPEPKRTVQYLQSPKCSDSHTHPQCVIMAASLVARVWPIWLKKKQRFIANLALNRWILFFWSDRQNSSSYEGRRHYSTLLANYVLRPTLLGQQPRWTLARAYKTLLCQLVFWQASSRK
jgi:hypothetical protein